MSSEKKSVGEAEQTLDYVQTLVVKPLLNHFSTWEYKPVERIISVEDARACYTRLFKLFSSRSQHNDNYQEYVYNQEKQTIVSFYKQLKHSYKTTYAKKSVLDLLCCKWKEMEYISQIMTFVLSYTNRNYASRTEKTQIAAVIKDCFVKYIFSLLKDDVMSSIRNHINTYRHHPNGAVLDTVPQAVAILYACGSEDDKEVTTEFERLVVSDAYHFYCHRSINRTSMKSILNDLDSSCSVERQICAIFSIPNTESRLQEVAISCLLKDTLGDILSRYMPSLYPEDLGSLKRILFYTKHMNAVDVLAEQFKSVLIASGMKLFNEYKDKIAKSKNHAHVNWEYVKQLAHTSYETSLVQLLSSTHSQTIKSELEGTPILFQSLYSAIGSVSDHCLSSSVSVASGIAEYIDHVIRNENLSAINWSAQLNELLFLYSNINGKDEFVNTYNTLLSRRLLSCSARNLDLERNVISLIRSKTGGLTVNTMESILNDISNNFSDGMNRKMQSLLHFPDFQFSVNVLTGGVWPSLPESEFEDLDKTESIRCPAEMEEIMQTFSRQPKDSERSFRWSFVRGYVTMTMLPIQCVVLMQFQKDEVWTVTEISQRVNANLNLVKQVVSSLVFSRFQLLKKVSGSESGMDDHDRFTYNTEFNPSNDRIRLKGLLNSQKLDHEANAVIKYTESYKACIVKIVKQCRSISIRDLKKQVLEKMEEWNMEEEDFTKCVDSLIDSEYLQRNSRRMDVIEYA